MKKNYILTFVLCLFILNIQAQTYVNSSASGANDGSTWADAYTDLSMALANTMTGDIWVANGTYLPGSGTGTTASRFAVINPVNLYGGFAGTEISLEDRDLNNLNTILSGDIGGDDVTGDYAVNRTDNSRHVMYVDSLVNNTIIDGFTISGGNTDAFVTGAEIYTYAGGGLFSWGGLTLINSTFTDNYGGNGAAAYIRGGSNAVITAIDCHENYADGSGIFQIVGIDGVIVSDGDFDANIVGRGALYPQQCTNVSVSECSFTDNVNPNGYGGGGMFVYNCLNFLLDECDFSGNVAARAAGMYIDGRDLPANEISNTISNCTFDENSNNNASTAGTLLMYILSANVTDCEFTNNTGLGSGGAISAFGDNRTAVISGCEFEGNTGSFGGAISYQSLGNVTFNDNTFSVNSAVTSGGAAIAAFGPTTTWTNNLFENNTAGFGAGLYCQTETTVLDVVGNVFEGNIAENTGGAILASSGASYQITDNEFSINTASTGGAIHSTVDLMAETPGENAVISRNAFVLNTAGQGSAINLNARSAQITDCLFAENNATETGTGTISLNAADTVIMDVIIANNTLVANTGALSQGVATWTGMTDAVLTAYFQNNIFANDDAINYAVEDGVPTAISNGGNLSNDASMDAILTATNDISGIDNDPLFTDVNDEDYTLQQASPCVNSGIDLDATSIDILGTPRVDIVDMGAFESPFLINTKEVIKNSKDVSVQPNPVVQTFVFSLENAWTGDFNVSIYTLDGKLIQNNNFTKNSTEFNTSIDISNFNAGLYTMIVSNKQELYKSTIIKK